MVSSKQKPVQSLQNNITCSNVILRTLNRFLFAGFLQHDILIFSFADISRLRSNMKKALVWPRHKPINVVFQLLYTPPAEAGGLLINKLFRRGELCLLISKLEIRRTHLFIKKMMLLSKIVITAWNTTEYGPVYGLCIKAIRSLYTGEYTGPYSVVFHACLQCYICSFKMVLCTWMLTCWVNTVL